MLTQLFLSNRQHTLEYTREQFRNNTRYTGGSVAEWLACCTQAQKGLGSDRSRDAVG